MGTKEGLRLYGAIIGGTKYDATNHLHQKALEQDIGALLGDWIVPTPRANIKYLKKGRFEKLRL